MQPVQGDSNGITIDGVLGTNPVVNGTGAGVHGVSKNAGPGVLGESIDGRGVQGISTNNYGIRAHSDKIAGIRASSTESRGVEGWSTKSEGVVGISTNGTGVWGQTDGAGNGVLGTSKTGDGVHGISETAYGIKGESTSGRGVAAFSDTNYGLRAVSRTLSAARCSSSIGTGVEGEAGGAGDGVRGTSISGNGINASSETGRGVNGFSKTGQAIYGHSIAQAGLVGESDQFDGIFGFTHSPLHAGVSGHNPGGMAGFFEGDVVVTGDVKLTGGNDVAENFSVINTNAVAPGCVMIFKEDGSIESCNKAYDKKVAGVISGAGDYRPGLVLGKIETEADRMPIALVGKVFCWVDADLGSVEVGDLLTTSSTKGHAMKAEDAFKAFGAVIGKALKPLIKGKGLIPILVALQ